ncbi:MAG TPA: DNA/RNA non-specific endonuclease [Kofleriaceae bacterium]|jgi:endonuclease G|nr:DNA/RNA non-specific endonuclease [Kofleriaceae bacterium]
MRYQNSRWFSVAIILAFSGATTGCLDGAPSDDSAAESGDITPAATLSEGFEIGTKTAYAVGDVTLGSGVWTMNDALIGNLSADVKTATQSGRIRNSGRITMRFDRTTGAGTVTIHHASFGTDTSGTWALFESQNGGSTWTQVGTSRSTTGGSFSTASFTVNLAGNIRFDIRKLDGGSNRINIDDITITDFTSSGGGTGAALSKHTTLGIPAPASTSNTNAFLSVKSEYVLSYNGSRKVPNWVSWELNSSYLGSTPRQDDFRPDDTFPPSVPQASLADYSGSGYDRGHMCPSADRTLTVTANSQTFYLTNMVPQAANNNQGPWASLENDCRALVQAGKELFIISGGTFSASSNTVGSGVVVPDETFKVIVVLDAVGQGPSNVTANTRVIGVLMPNENTQISKSADWHNFRVSVDSIETLTGDDFLSDVDPTVQAVVEARVDNL